MYNMELAKFLVQAKVNTYASGDTEVERKLFDGCKELVYREDGLKYRDRYFGGNPFIGEEIVWSENDIVWGMNYYGTVFSDEVSAKSVYQFLQKAMRQITEDRPFRGPENFKKGDFKYVDKSNGSINMFQGIETILYKEREVYRLCYHGGLM